MIQLLKLTGLEFAVESVEDRGEPFPPFALSWISSALDTMLELNISEENQRKVSE